MPTLPMKATRIPPLDASREEKVARAVPTLYASSAFGVQLGLSYGMPKQPPLPIEIQLAARMFRAHVHAGIQQSFLWARLLGASGLLTRVVRAILPLKTWPIAFSSGSSLEPGLTAADRAHLAHIQAGRLALDVSWLPPTTAFFSLGLYLKNAQLELPEPQRNAPFSLVRKIEKTG